MQKYSFKYILQELKQYKKELIIANLIALFAVAIITPAPLLIPLLVDEVLLNKPGIVVNTIDSILNAHQESYVYVLIILILTILLRALFFILSVLQNWIFTIISKNITYKIRKDLLNRISKVSLSEYQNFSSGKILSLMMIDVDTVDKFLSVSISRLIISVLTVIGVGFVLMMIHWQLALFILLLNPFIMFLTTKIARKVSKLKKEENLKIALFQEALGETLDLFAQVKASNQESKFVNKLIKKAKNIKNAAIEFEYKSDAASKFSFLLFLTGFEIFRAAGILVVAYSDLSIGLMLAVFGYLWVIMNPVNEIINIQYAFANAKAALSRINSIYDMKLEPNYEHKKNPFLNNFTNSIELNGIYFEHEKNKPILKDINMSIKKGSKIAIVGASGSGKTTLAQIIVGFYPPTRGTLSFDKIDVKEIGLDVVREHVFLVLQSPTLFNDTIRFNLTFGENIDEKRIKKALKIAQLDDFVNSLEKGLDTVVGANGVKLSGGQRQRISIARMVIANPNVVILDESTSALDVKTESKLFYQLSLFLKGRTTIIVAHRLSTIKQADFVYVLDRGEIIQKGSLEELLDSVDGKFAQYFNRRK